MSGAEEEIIRRYFRGLTASRTDVRVGIGDDAAVLHVPEGMDLVASTDSLNPGIHFAEGSDAADIGFRSLAVNLSDIAAMGAEPRWALLALTLPQAHAEFLEPFCRGLKECANGHGVALVGGNLSRGPLSITVQVLGTVPAGMALLRSGARQGDEVWVSGVLGAAALGLAVLEGRHAGAGPGVDACMRRLQRPLPRIDAGCALRGVAHAAIDISDGLLTDLGHVLRESGVGAEVNLADLPIPEALAALPDVRARWQFAIAGGDDYELCYTVRPANAEAAAAAVRATGVAATRIGVVTAEPGLRWLSPAGEVVDFGAATGYQHF
jgi:thiamine-monophosphate kinase